SGHLSGSSATQLTAKGAGKLTLTNDNSGFSGPFKIDNSDGNAIVAITNTRALGSPVNATTIATNTQLQVNLPASGTINNPLVVNGAGPDGATGAVYMNPDPTVRGPVEVTWAGDIQMNSDNGVSNTTFGVANVQGTVTNASAQSPIVITTGSTAQLYTG